MATPAKKIGVALVGCGHRGKQMAELLCSDARFHMTAFVDDEPGARKNEIGVAEYASDPFWDSVAYKTTDLVMVASVNNLHAEHIRRPLVDGKYVFCEKPLFTEWDEELVGIIRANCQRFCTGFVLRHAPLYKKIKELLPKIGPIRSGTVSDLLHRGHGALIFGGAWRHDKTASGGHVVEKLVHVIDLIVWYLGSPTIDAVEGLRGPDAWTRDKKSVSERWMALSNNPELLGAYKFHGSKDPFDHEPGDSELIASSGNLVLRFQTGATIGLHFDTACPESRREFYLVGETGTIHAVWSSAETFVRVMCCGIGTKASKGNPSSSELFQFESAGCHGGGDEYIINALKNTVLHGQPPNPTAEEALLTMKVTLVSQKNLA